MCALSGKPIDEHNPPMVLPNGNVYGRLVSAGYGRLVKRCRLEGRWRRFSRQAGWSVGVMGG